MMMHSLLGPVSYNKEIKEMIDKKNLVNININIIKTPSKSMEVVGSWQDIYDTIRIDSEKQKEEYENEGYKITKDLDGNTVAKKFLEYGDESLAIVYNEQRNDLIKRIALDRSRVVILTSRIAHGEILRDLIGPRARLINGQDDLATRKKGITYLQENEEAILIGSNILNTGVNIQNIKTLINAAGGTSPILAEQKIGRSSRKSDTIEKLLATVYDFDDSFHPMTRKQSRKRIELYNSLKLPIIKLDEY
jgi:superfamily II DNA or RNA helicase